MVPAALKRSLRGSTPSDILKRIPDKFTLGAGHVTFFYDKMVYLRIRYDYLLDELLSRGFNLENRGDFTPYLNDIPDEFLISFWIPSDADILISKTRIEEKIAMKPNWYRFRGEPLK